MATKTVLVIGGTGAQGVPIVQELDQHGYRVSVLTRDPESEHSQRLRSVAPNVQYVTGTPTDEDALRSAFAGVDYAFVNLNSFALGIKNEIYWGIRTFEIAVQSGVKHYIWSSLDNYALETNYDDDLRCGHYYGKGHVKQWMSALPQSPMKWSVVCTGPYIEQLWYFQHPKKSESGVYDFRLPIDDGVIPYVCLDDMGYYVRWIYERPERSAGLNLDIGVEDVSLEQIAKAFTDATGKPAKATNLTIGQWTQETGLSEEDMEHKIGTSTAPGDPSLLTFRQNFSAWWRIYQNCGTKLGLCKRDYKLLDEIYPGRIRSLKQWMEKVGYDGDATRTFEAGIPWGM
ncbi:hypothetical protein Trisim1_009504 [Trichoderma cf. simile WF8]|uniref:NmrA family protein n=1 Tax=Trichoderma guizhouense TaxID=1491466 RepID=A0A1T3CWW3_9HYPO|nr:NmrA family protein [Trichoderma guizhouense]